jgi:hypothetical protein
MSNRCAQLGTGSKAEITRVVIERHGTPPSDFALACRYVATPFVVGKSRTVSDVWFKIRWVSRTGG